MFPAGYNPELAVFKIAEATDLYKELKLEKEKAEKLCELTYLNLIDTVKREVNYDFIYFGLELATKWLNMLKSEKIDKRRSYEEKGHYDFLCTQIQENITDRPVKITSIDDGYITNTGSIKFTVEGCDTLFYLSYPASLKNFNESNFLYNCGKLQLGIYSDPKLEVLAFSYNVKDLKEKFASIIGIETGL